MLELEARQSRTEAQLRDLACGGCGSSVVEDAVCLLCGDGEEDDSDVTWSGDE
jgi:hypothetical protein